MRHASPGTSSPMENQSIKKDENNVLHRKNLSSSTNSGEPHEGSRSYSNENQQSLSNKEKSNSTATGGVNNNSSTRNSSSATIHERRELSRSPGNKQNGRRRRHSSRRHHRHSYSEDEALEDDDTARKDEAAAAAVESKRHSRRKRSTSRQRRGGGSPPQYSTQKYRRSSSSRSYSGERRVTNIGDKKQQKRSRRSHSKPNEHKTRSRRRSRSQSEDKSSIDKKSSTSRGSSIPKRKRRTGWDTAPPDHVTATLPSTATVTPQSMTPTTTGFTASLAGKSAEEWVSKIMCSKTEPNPQAASLAASLQLKATASQLCRIYVGSLDYSLTDQDIRQVFSAFGTITSIDMPKEGTRSKGFCFIEYATPESAEMAIATMPGFNLKGRAIKVGRPTALGGQSVSAMPLTSLARTGGVNAAEAGQIAAAMLLAKTEGHALGLGSPDDAQNRIYVGCIPHNFTADDIKQIFSVFGKILSCQLIPSSDKPGTHRGYGFIEYSTFDEAKLAIETMNNFQIAGKGLKVNHATVMRGLNPAMPGASAGAAAAALMAAATIPSSATGANAVPVQQASLLQPGLTGVLPGNLNLLGNPGGMTNVPEALSSNLQMSINKLPQSLIPQATPPIVSPVLMLSDMVDVSEANDELKEEIRQECSKHGVINDITIAVDAARNLVRIFTVFQDPKSAAKAVPLLHERWFGGRRIQARLYDQSMYAAGTYWL